MATGFESIMGGVYMLIFNAFFASLLLIINIASVVVLSTDKSWFVDPITNWLSVNTIISFVTIFLLLLACVFICKEYGDPCRFSMAIRVMFWLTKISLVMWGTYEYVTNHTSFENSEKMSLAVICLQWIGISLLSLLSLKAICCSAEK